MSLKVNLELYKELAKDLAHEDILYTGLQPQKTWDETQREYYGQLHGENRGFGRLLVCFPN